MPLPSPPTRKGDNARLPTRPSSADKELLFKGVLCALIGIVILVAPHIARSGSVQEMIGGASVVGWFALALGAGFIGLFVRRRFTGPRAH